MAGPAPTRHDRLIADGNVMVELVWLTAEERGHGADGNPGLGVVQSFGAGDVSELGLRWFHRTFERIDETDRAVLRRHLLLPEALLNTERGRPRGWRLAGLPSGSSQILATRRTGTGDSIRSGLALSDQLASLFDVLERIGIADTDLNASRCLIVDDGGHGTIVGVLGASTTVDGVPLLLDAPPATNVDRFALARLVDQLLPAGIRDHPTLRDLRALERCWLNHQLSLPPAMWRTALEGAISRLRVATDRPVTIDIRAEPVAVIVEPIPRAAPNSATALLDPLRVPPVPALVAAPAAAARAEPAPAIVPPRPFQSEATPTGPVVPPTLSEPDPIPGLVGLTIEGLSAHRRTELMVLAVLAVAVLVLAAWTLATI